MSSEEWVLMGQINALSAGLGGPTNPGITIHRHQRWTALMEVGGKRVEARNEYTLVDALTKVRNALQSELDRRMKILQNAQVVAASGVPEHIERMCNDSGAHRRHYLDNGDTCPGRSYDQT